MSDIFISYASEDRERAGALAKELADRGWSVWWDREIPLGRDYDDVIQQHAESARCIIVLWSGSSVKSRWVKTEAAAGEQRGVLIPVRIERDIKPPFAFMRLQAANLTDWIPGVASSEFDRLTRGIIALLANSSTSNEAAHSISPSNPLAPGSTCDDGSQSPVPGSNRNWLWSTFLALAVLIAGIATVARWSVPKPNGLNLVVNGSFEDPVYEPNTYNLTRDIPGWQVEKGVPAEIQRTFEKGRGHDGEQYLELDGRDGNKEGIDSNSRISQTVATIPGHHYRLSFWYAARPDQPADTIGIKVLFDGKMIATVSQTSSGTTDWRHFEYDVVASGASSVVAFEAVGTPDGYGGLLDSVSVIPTLRPHI
jgi:hypothetical protein